MVEAGDRAPFLHELIQAEREGLALLLCVRADGERGVVPPGELAGIVLLNCDQRVEVFVAGPVGDAEAARAQDLAEPVLVPQPGVRREGNRGTGVVRSGRVLRRLGGHRGSVGA